MLPIAGWTTCRLDQESLEAVVADLRARLQRTWVGSDGSSTVLAVGLAPAELARRAALVDQETRFLERFETIRQAYATRTMRYECLVARKTGDRPRDSAN